MDNKSIPRQFSLSEFKEQTQGMVAKNHGSYSNQHDIFWGASIRKQVQTIEDVQAIIETGNIRTLRALSRRYFSINGFYRQMIMHYGTLLKQLGILIPNPSYGKSLQDKPIAKRYYGALNLVESMNLEEKLTDISIKVLVEGVYYGVIHTLTKSDFILMDLPLEYCRVEHQDSRNRDKIEFNTAFFDRISDVQLRKEALKAYPDFIVQHYYYTKDNRGVSSWMFIPTELGVSFKLFNERPYFLPLIPITLQYDDAVAREAEKEREEIKKILVQKIPHLNDGTLLFEPDEVAVMHEGTVDMLSTTNPNLSVLTTYGDVTVEQTKTTGNVNRNSLEHMTNHLYATAGVTSQIFSADSVSGIGPSLQFDTSVMMILANQYALLVSRVVNTLYSNTQIDFKYTILPVSEYNRESYIADAFKLAQSGYSLLLPAIAQGVSQRDLLNLKELENGLLGLQGQLVPPQSAHTSTGKGATDEGGRPALKVEEKTEKTLANEESLEKGGGGQAHAEK